MEKLGEASNNKYSEYESRATNSEYRKLGSYINGANKSIYTPIFLGEDGKIDAVIKTETFAGRGDYNFIIDVE